MTAQTPAPKASGLSALLAPLSNAPPPSPTAAKNDFLTQITQALTAQSGSSDRQSAAHPVKAKDATSPTSTATVLLPAWLASLVPALSLLPTPKVSATAVPADPSVSGTETGAEANSTKDKPSSTTDAATPDLNAASLLLALLTAPGLSLPQIAVRKVSAASGDGVPAAQVPPLVAAQTTAEAKTATSATAEKRPLAQVLAPFVNEPESKTQLPTGTSAANTSQRMSFTPERNEIAGRTEPKLPPIAISAISGGSAGGLSSDGGAKSSLNFAWHEAAPEPLTIVDLSAQASIPAVAIAENAVDAPLSTSSVAPVERLERVISREVMTIRQTGAETLGVSLKLDSATQIFLQLTTHNGAVQASVRCERGSFAPEDAQWAQLQQSLARQNVVLLPMSGGTNLNYQPPSEEHPRRQAKALEDWGTANTPVQPVPPRKQKEQNRSRRNWESWA